MIRLLIAALAVCFAGSAWATTLTFGQQSPNPVVEQGYTFTNWSTYNYGAPQIYLHDDAGGQLSVTIRQLNGGQFSAKSVDLLGGNRIYTTGTQAGLEAIGGYADYRSPWAKAAKPSFDNFQIQGFRNGQLVASTTGMTTHTGFTTNFDRSFSNLTSITFSLKKPDFDYLPGMYWVPLTPLTNYCDQYCSSVFIRNLTLEEVVSPVPLPASGLLLGMGLLGVGALRLRKRHQA